MRIVMQTIFTISSQWYLCFIDSWPYHHNNNRIPREEKNRRLQMWCAVQTVTNTRPIRIKRWIHLHVLIGFAVSAECWSNMLNNADCLPKGDNPFIWSEMDEYGFLGRSLSIVNTSKQMMMIFGEILLIFFSYCGRKLNASHIRIFIRPIASRTRVTSKWKFERGRLREENRWPSTE